MSVPQTQRRWAYLAVTVAMLLIATGMTLLLISGIPDEGTFEAVNTTVPPSTIPDTTTTTEAIELVPDTAATDLVPAVSLTPDVADTTTTTTTTQPKTTVTTTTTQPKTTITQGPTTTTITTTTTQPKPAVTTTTITSTTTTTVPGGEPVVEIIDVWIFDVHSNAVSWPNVPANCGVSGPDDTQIVIGIDYLWNGVWQSDGRGMYTASLKEFVGDTQTPRTSWGIYDWATGEGPILTPMPHLPRATWNGTSFDCTWDY